MPFKFPLQKQIKDKWCWAAVTRSVDRYFNPKSTLDQCTVAQLVLGRSCCPDADDCNQVEFLEKALSRLDRIDGVPVRFGLSFADICESIDNRMPICARIGWNGGGGHFVLICGYRKTSSGRQLLEIADPLFPSSLVPYEDFISGYQNMEQPRGGGKWTHTYRLKK